MKARRYPYHSLPGREQRRWREMAPLATGPHEVEQPIENPPYVGGARPTTRLDRQDPRLDQAVLIITQGLAGSAIPDPCPILLRPQSPLRKGKLSLGTPANPIPCR